MDFQIDVTELESAAEAMAARSEQFLAEAEHALDEVTDELLRLIESEVPVDTGALEASIRATRRKSGGGVFGNWIIADSPYAAYNEFGTHKMGAAPFMYPHVHEARDALADEIAAIATEIGIN